MDGKNVEIFYKGFNNIKIYWERFGSEAPEFKNKNVLEIGCGWGSMVVDIAEQGAAKVTGLDINCKLIEFANNHVNTAYKEIKDNIEFKCIDLRKYDNEDLFDIIISKDAFEHIMDLKSMLNEMSRRLKPGGKIYIGFGPLYNSPYGDHDRRKKILKSYGLPGKFIIKLPWGHLFFSKFIVKAFNNKNENKIVSLKDLQLNMLKYTDYINIFNSSELKIKYLKYNQSKSIQSKVMSFLALFPGLKNYCVHNIYCILEKPES